MPGRGAAADAGATYKETGALHADDAACRGVCVEMVRLSRRAWPAGYTSSPIAVPILWAAAWQGNLRGLHCLPTMADAAEAMRRNLRGVRGSLLSETQEWVLRATRTCPDLQMAIGAVHQYHGDPLGARRTQASASWRVRGRMWAPRTPAAGLRVRLAELMSKQAM